MCRGYLPKRKLLVSEPEEADGKPVDIPNPLVQADLGTGSLPQATAKTNVAKAMPRMEVEVMARMGNSKCECRCRQAMAC
jgi:hypothetical protein